VQKFIAILWRKENLSKSDAEIIGSLNLDTINKKFIRLGT
jgi:hypothetical protein